ncbi:MAG TPA: hypothetical protein IAB63_09560 [Candidatus Onthocola gallistercoris]|uniref:Uncharacterized protein n=1 Tax=Candidatus Onthocola gallistercoris TaxID=2840876 RepID=A0A9D1KXH1_9FIRM|nr:hypothetical protein [Candidatus Onthocola gallistercoris]
MPDKVYSFTKIEKKHTYAGEYALISGIVSCLFLAGLVIAGVVTGGRLNIYICGLAYVTLALSAVGWYKSSRAISRVSVSGRYLHTGRLVSMIATLLHLAVFMTGILEIIL